MRDAWQELQRVGDLYGDTKDDVAAAQQRLITAKAADVQAIVKATNEGTEVKDSQPNERKAEAEISRLTTMLRGLRQAADEAGNRLAQMIDQHRDEWRDQLNESREDAAARYDSAIAEAKAALAELIPASAGVGWVEDFDLGLARTGQYTGFAGGRLRVNGRGHGVSDLRKDYSPADLLTIAALATSEPEQREVVSV